jgi:hypothetical protein
MVAPNWRLFAVLTFLSATSVLAQDAAASSGKGLPPTQAARLACQLLRAAFPQLVAFPGE